MTNQLSSVALKTIGAYASYSVGQAVAQDKSRRKEQAKRRREYERKYYRRHK